MCRPGSSSTMRSEVARDVHHDGPVRRLAGQARPAAAHRDRRVVVAADADDLHQIVGIQRPHDADRKLSVVRRIGRVQGAVARRELDFAADVGAQIGGEGIAAGRGGGFVFHRLSIPGWAYMASNAGGRWNSPNMPIIGIARDHDYEAVKVSLGTVGRLGSWPRHAMNPGR